MCTYQTAGPLTAMLIFARCVAYNFSIPSHSFSFSASWPHNMEHSINTQVLNYIIGCICFARQILILLLFHHAILHFKVCIPAFRFSVCGKSLQIYFKAQF